MAATTSGGPDTGMSPVVAEVVVIGNPGVDTSVFLPPASDSGHETRFVETVDSLGHSGGYSVRAYSRLGRRVALIGQVGEDYHARMIRKTLIADGVNCDALFSDPAGTLRSVNLISPDGQRRGFYDGKGHMTFQPDLAACATILSGARLAHFSLPNWARHLIPMARAAGATVACDLQDVVEADDPYRRDFVAGAEILFFSTVNQQEPEPLIRQFLAGPARIVVAGMGAAGVALGTAAGISRHPPVSLPAPVVDTTGAGDSLAAAFLTAHVLEGRPLEEALHRGQIAARHTCSQRATSATLITGTELEAWNDAVME